MRFERIIVDPEVMGGVPGGPWAVRRGRHGRVDGGEGTTVEEICRDLPGLSPEDVSELLRYVRRRCGNGNYVRPLSAGYPSSFLSQLERRLEGQKANTVVWMKPLVGPQPYPESMSPLNESSKPRSRE